MTTTTQYPPYIIPRTETLTPEEQRLRLETSKFLIEFSTSGGHPLSEHAIEFLDRHAQGEYDIDSQLLSAHLWNKKRQAEAL
ncbi:hypothetical protein [Xanthomonas arboricola]|uniref:hypothetical protein n=1 Tax=Xanthomonas arboricola TaxID=56448 RepID=UPI000F8F08DF|nr:hypothetical protein [Xanthomonas arboricola]